MHATLWPTALKFAEAWVYDSQSIETIETVDWTAEIQNILANIKNMNQMQFSAIHTSF